MPDAVSDDPRRAAAGGAFTGHVMLEQAY